MKKIAIIGGGTMGSALARGLMLSGAYTPADIIISNPHVERLAQLKEMGVELTTSNIEAVYAAPIIIIAVKPWIAPDVTREIGPHVKSRQTICSIAAGSCDMNAIAKCCGFPEDVVLASAMPNTAMSVDRSLTFLVAERGDVSALHELFSNVGTVMELPAHLMPAATSLSSCGIAYAMRYVRAAQEGGVELGFTPQMAQEIVVETVKGAMALLSLENAHPESEIDRVTTAGGLTIRGLNAMEAAGFSSAVVAGLKASMKKEDR